METIIIDPSRFVFSCAQDDEVYELINRGRTNDKVNVEDHDRIAYRLTMLGYAFGNGNIPRESQPIGADNYATELVNAFLYAAGQKKVWSYRLQGESRWAHMLLEFMKMSPFKVVVLSMQDLGFDPKSNSLDIRLSQIAEKAATLGFEPCPQTLAAAFRFAKISIPHGARISIVSDPIRDTQSDDPKMFAIEGGQRATHMSRDHHFLTDAHLAEIADNGGQMLFSGSSQRLPGPDKFGFMFKIPQTTTRLPAVHTTAIETLSHMLLKQSLGSHLQFMHTVTGGVHTS